MVRRGIVAGFRGNGIIRSGRVHDHSLECEHLYGNGVSIIPNSLPVMGVAARAIWISQRLRRGNTVKSEKLRGRETVLGFYAGKSRACECGPLEKVQPLELDQGWRAVCDESCKHGSGRGHAIPARVNGPYSTCSSSLSISKPMRSSRCIRRYGTSERCLHHGDRRHGETP